MQTIREFRDRMIRELCAIYPERESFNQVVMLFKSVAGINIGDFSLHPGKVIDDNTETLLLNKLEELMRMKPVQYVTGTACFYDMELEVNNSVLIPRPETEELVKWIADDWKGKSGLRVLDIGTGSGNIILALGRLLVNPILTAIDISPGALEVANKNAEKNGVHVSFLRKDILNESDWDLLERYDLIVSNPPYVRFLEKKRMQSNVLDYEPHQALFVPDDDPLLFYKAIAAFSSDRLKEKGNVYVEINEVLGHDTRDIFYRSGLSRLILKQDLNGKNRMIRACF